MKKNKVFKIIALAALILIVAGLFIPEPYGMICEIIAATTLFVVAILSWIVPSKDNTKFKLIALISIYLAVLSWMIPAGTLNGSEVVSLDLMRMSVYQLFEYPYLAVQFFLQPLLFILAVGGFYGVLKETGKYRNKLEKIAKSMKGKETLFLAAISFVLAALSSVSGINLLLFVIIPALCGIIILMGYNKMTAFLTTFISPLIGVIGSTYAVSITGYINEIIGSSWNTELIAKIALFVISYLVYISFLISYAKKTKAKNADLEEQEEIRLIGEKKQSKKASWPIILILSLLSILLVLGCTTWEASFEMVFFTDIYETITEWAINEHTIIAYLIEDLKAFGEWSYPEITALLLMATVVISYVYNLKSENGLKAFGSGVKNMFKPAILVIFAYVAVIITAYHPYIVTVSDWMMSVATMASGVFGDILYIVFTSLNTVLSSVLNVEMLYVVQSTLPYVSAVYPDYTNSLAIITQSIYGLTLFVAPTSTMLLLGLSYLDIPYKEWLKTSGKLVLELLAIIVLIILVVVFI